MASLGYAATGAGQGVLQQRQYNDEQARQRQLYGLQERQVGLQEQGLEEDKKARNREFNFRRINQIESILRDPESKNRYTRGELDKMQRDLDRMYAQNPDLDLRDHTPAQPNTQPSAPPAPSPDQGLGATAQQVQAAAANPALYGIPTGPPPAPTNEQQIQQDIPQMGATQFDPMGVRGMPERPIPNTGVGVTGSQNAPVAGSFPPNILPSPANPDATAVRYLHPEGPGQAPRSPMASQPTPEQMPLGKQLSLALQQQALAKFQESKDPNLAPADRDRALQLAVNTVGQIAQIEGTNAQTVIAQLQAQFLPAGEVAKIENLREQTRAQQMETDVFKPRELDLKDQGQLLEHLAKMRDAADKAQDRALAMDQFRLQIKKYGLDERQFDAQLQQQALQMGLTAAQIKDLQSRPDWRTELAAKTAAQNAYSKNWISQTPVEGPTLGLFNQMMSGVPGMGQPGVNGPVQTYETFPHSAYINDPASSPQAKVQFYKSQGWQVPPELIAKAKAAKPKAKPKK